MKLTGKIDENGVLHMAHRDVLIDWIRQHPNKHIEFEIKVRRKQRSNNQNAYMWGVVVPMVCNSLRHLGHDVDEEETHELLKSKFNSRKVANEHGEFIELPTSTTRLTTIEMMEYIARIQQWAAEFLGLVVPDPESQLTIELHDQVNDTKLIVHDKI